MRIFITGTESFVGRELITQCNANNIEHFGCDYIQPSNRQFHQIDIRSKNIIDVIPEGIDTIVHLAALSTDSQCRNNTYECFDINVLGTLNLINAARQKNIKQFIFASSEWVYGEDKGNQIQREDSLIDITKLKSEYALSKLISENNLRKTYDNGFCDVTILRFGIIYGPRENNWSAVESLFNEVKTKDTVRVGSLKTARRFIHVSDVASGILAALGCRGFEIFNLCGGELISLKDVINTASKVLGRSPRIIETNPQAVNIRNPSNDKISRVLNWRPKLNLELGLKTLIIDSGKT